MDPTDFPEPAAARAARRAARSGWGAPLAGGLVGAAVASFAPDWLRASPFEFDFATLLCLPVVAFLVLFVHECGHLCGGWAAGLRPLALVVGPLHVAFDAQQRPRMARNRSWAAIGGLALCAPRRNTGRGAMAVMVAAGPAASLALALGCGALAFALAEAGAEWWGGLLLSVGTLSLMITLVTAMPLRAGGMVSDGGQLVALARGDGAVRVKLALAALLAALCDGVRPRELDADLLAALDPEPEDPAVCGAALYLKAQHSDDSGDRATADGFMRGVARIAAESADSALSGPARAGFALAVATWVALRRREPELAQRWLDASAGGIHEPGFVAVTRAAIAQQRGDSEAARAAQQLVIERLPRVADPWSQRALREALAELGIPA